MVFFRFAVLAVALAVPALPAAASNPSQLAPADEYFGHYRLSVLGIANTIRDARARLDEGRNADGIINGPLAFASDAIRDWQSKYPRDTWIPRDLAALEIAYAHARTYRGEQLARETHAWLAHDYPYATAEGPRFEGGGQSRDALTSAWERFAAMRLPLPR